METKTFYHFDLPTSDHLEGDNQSVEQIVGHYISKQYHSQFDSNRNEIYTFIEKIQNNRVIYEFYQHDPYEQAAINAKILKMALKNILIIKFKVLVSFILVMVVLI